MKYKVTFYSNALCSGRVVRQNEVIIGGKNQSVVELLPVYHRMTPCNIPIKCQQFENCDKPYYSEELTIPVSELHQV